MKLLIYGWLFRPDCLIPLEFRRRKRKQQQQLQQQQSKPLPFQTWIIICLSEPKKRRYKVSSNNNATHTHALQPARINKWYDNFWTAMMIRLLLSILESRANATSVRESQRQRIARRAFRAFWNGWKVHVLRSIRTSASSVVSSHSFVFVWFGGGRHQNSNRFSPGDESVIIRNDLDSLVGRNE